MKVECRDRSVCPRSKTPFPRPAGRPSRGVERAIREPAIGRKNFLFTGSTAAAKRIAIAYSLVQTCRALGINTREYLVDVLTKLERRWPARRLTELLPHHWAANRS